MTLPDFPKGRHKEDTREHGAVAPLSPSELGPLVAPWVPPKAQSKAGGATQRVLVFSWGGVIPETNSQGTIWEAPFDVDGTSLNFTLERAVVRMEQTFASDQKFLLQKASGGDLAFASPSTIVEMTIASGHYRTTATGLAFAVASGELVGLYFSAAGALAPFTLELIGSA